MVYLIEFRKKINALDTHKFKDCIFELLIGDTLGVPYKFCNINIKS